MEPRILERREHPISRRDIDPNVLRVLYRLISAGHVAYLVGGSVRDLMLQRRPKDFDVATSAHPQQVRDLFRNSRLIGRRFRLIHVFFGPKNIEVATFRRKAEAVAESEDPIIHTDNTFGTPEEDAFRRDFTVNALFYDPQTFRVIDYAGGVDDLSARLIRTIGEPEVRVREDPVRMMRAVRFAAKLGFEIEPATRDAIERHRADLLKSSVPRLVEETYRTLGQSEAPAAFLLMEELGLLNQLLPFLSAHIRQHPPSVADPPTVCNLAALARGIERTGEPPSHAVILAAMFLDFYRVRMRSAPQPPRGQHPVDGFDLLAELRARGFPRGDTEHMRLLLEAFEQLAAPTRRTRRLMRRPYFDQAREFFEMMAPGYQIDVEIVSRLIADPEGFFNARPALPQGQQPGGGHRRRRRRRRRNRMRGRGSVSGLERVGGATPEADSARQSGESQLGNHDGREET